MNWIEWLGYKNESELPVDFFGLDLLEGVLVEGECAGVVVLVDPAGDEAHVDEVGDDAADLCHFGLLVVGVGELECLGGGMGNGLRRGTSQGGFCCSCAR